MKSEEPSRMALMVARQRAAHQLLDHGAILDDPYAVRILGEPEESVSQAVKSHLAEAAAKTDSILRRQKQISVIAWAAE